MNPRMPPVPPEQNPDYIALRVEINNLNTLVGRSFAGMNSWRDKDSFIRGLEDAQKRFVILKKRLDDQYAVDKVEYDQWLIEVQMRTEENIRKSHSSIASLSVADEQAKSDDKTRKINSSIGSLEI